MCAQHYKVKEGSRAVELLEEGVLEAEVFLGVADLWAEDNTWADFVVTAVRAKECFKRDKDYIVKDGQVIIVDEFTGRSQPGRRYSDHLHQALEAKEGVPIQPEMRTIAEITHQAFFRLYAKLAGMTGTAKTEVRPRRLGPEESPCPCGCTRIRLVLVENRSKALLRSSRI